MSLRVLASIVFYFRIRVKGCLAIAANQWTTTKYVCSSNPTKPDSTDSNTDVGRQFSRLSKRLAEMIGTQRQGEVAGRIADYLEARRKFEKMIGQDDYKYLSFQLWKEGVARYTEYCIARLAAQEYQPSKEFRALYDYKSCADDADKISKNIIHELATFTLAENKRELFLSVRRRRDPAA